MRDDGWLEVEEAVSIVEQACEGLYYAHRHGVVHRDVKPGNLLRSHESELKLADFGIAKATEQSSITQVGSVLGTAAYLAPEQARGEEAGPRADLYALGVVAYQLISGRLPYEAGSLTELALKQQQEEPAMLDTLVAAVTPELADAVAISLALDPRDRYGDARAMGRAMSDAQQGIPPSAPPRDADDHSTQATSLLTTAGVPSKRRATGSHQQASTPRQPRPGPPRANPEPLAGASSKPASRRSHTGRRFVAALLIVLAFAVIIAGVVLATSSPPTRVVLRRVVYKDVGRASEALSQLVSENTH